MSSTTHTKSLLDSDLESNDESENEFKINQDFASKYEKKKINDSKTDARIFDEEDEESEDEDGKFDSNKWNDDFITLLPMLSNKSSKLKDKNVGFFKPKDTITQTSEQHSDNSDDSDDNATTSKKKSMTLKDYQRNKILNQLDKDQYEEEEEGVDEEPEDFDSLPHVKQQEKLKKDFLKQANKINVQEESDSDDEFLKKRVKSKEDQDKEEKEFVEFKDKVDRLKKKSGLDESDHMLENFWKGENVDSEEKFLREYIVGQKWQSDKGKLPSYEEIMKELEADEGEVNRQDDFERVYNFRYEEPGAAVIVGNPREIKSSLRRKDTTRKDKRDKKKDRKEQEKAKKDEKLKVLKNEKKKEILEKVKEINSITGSKIFNLDSVDIKKMDPGVMIKAIGKKKVEPQYNDNSGDDDNGEQEDLGEEYGYSNESGLDINQLIESGYFDDEVEDDDQVWSDDKIMQERKELEDMLDQYYGIDYQDIIDDTPIRFQYTKVEPDDSGISVDDIINKDDKDLEKIVPISKIHPYANSFTKSFQKDYSKRQWDHKSKYHTWTSKSFTSKNNNTNNNNFNNYDKPKQNNNNKRKFDEINDKPINYKQPESKTPNNNTDTDGNMTKKRKSKNKNILTK